ncbi:protein translocase subunit SecD [Nocardioides sp.]|jgi:preprotein translocase subunit SecD|uniref:protein translocase subunit SecD n=1 Tax=Nocardioides sp. TaxID=35761 RepID=UPI002BE3A4D1|nr:protein translocase subunit SecD [Nocardioides sp.]HVX54479.1 protein translocase subunit SecD [Nocardioides sp.]
MARKNARPGRTLAVFFLVLAVVYGLVALGGKWKPELGLDLQGGTRIMMIANGHPTSEAMKQARSIIDERVNGSGVTAAKVTTQGSNEIIVDIPGQSRDDLVNEVSQTAQLRFRLVACQQSCSTSSSTSSVLPSTAPSSGASAPASGAASAPASGAPRAGLAYDLKQAKGKKKHKKHKAGTPSSSASPSATASAAPSTAASPSATPSTSTSPDQKGDVSVDQAVQFMNNPPADWSAKLDAYTCPAKGSANVEDNPSQPLVTCDSSGVKYLLSPAIIEGTQVSDANSGIPQNGVGYVVTLDFHSAGRKAFADATGAIAGTNQLFAIVLDGDVISAATADSRINGSAQISGNFTQASAAALANNLKFGALPVSFDKLNGISHSTIGPSLAGNQLSAGLWAGGIGLLLVMLYCLLYYRGLGLVVIGSLVVAGVTVYGMVLLLSKTADFTLDLPGIAGLIVAVGITADSFIVYFERIRDEMRDGKSMRVAVEAGWRRARNTCLAADGVSLLAALILYIFGAGDVRGFAFALGLSTAIDLVIFFFFTHPTIQWLSHYKFFNRGHRLSGLDAEALGVDRITVGGRA